MKKGIFGIIALVIVGVVPNCFSQDATALYNQGIDYFKKEDWVKAAQYFESANGKKKDWADALLWAGLASYNQWKRNAAGGSPVSGDKGTGVGALGPVQPSGLGGSRPVTPTNNSSSYYNRYSSTNQNSVARLGSAQPTGASAQAPTKVGQTGGYREHAISCLIRAIEMNPELVVELKRLGMNYGQIGSDLSAALKFFEMFPTVSGAWVVRGNIYLAQANYVAALDAFNRAISVDKDEAAAWYGLGRTYCLRREYDKAKEILQKLEKLDSERADKLRVFIQNPQPDSPARRQFPIQR